MIGKSFAAGYVRPPHRFLVFLLYSAWIGAALAAGQPQKSLADRSYRDEIIEKISRLLETRYVIPEKAKAFAERRQNDPAY